MRSKKALTTVALGLVLSVAVGCGPTTALPPNTIVISNLTFSPVNLIVTPGTTVTVQNNDAFDHSVTSEAAVGNFVPGSVNGVSFDTGPFVGGAHTFVIPTTAPSGTVVPYFCQVHTSMMNDAAHITIQ